MKRDAKNAVLGGVCAGMANKWGMDVKLVRILYCLGTLVSHGLGIFVYLLLWAFLEKEEE